MRDAGLCLVAAPVSGVCTLEKIQRKSGRDEQVGGHSRDRHRHFGCGSPGFHVKFQDKLSHYQSIWGTCYSSSSKVGLLGYPACIHRL